VALLGFAGQRGIGGLLEPEALQAVEVPLDLGVQQVIVVQPAKEELRGLVGLRDREEPRALEVLQGPEVQRVNGGLLELEALQGPEVQQGLGGLLASGAPQVFEVLRVSVELLVLEEPRERGVRRAYEALRVLGVLPGFEGQLDLEGPPDPGERQVFGGQLV
jgi:hypothetical protein